MTLIVRKWHSLTFVWKVFAYYLSACHIINAVSNNYWDKDHFPHIKYMFLVTFTFPKYWCKKSINVETLLKWKLHIQDQFMFQKRCNKVYYPSDFYPTKNDLGPKIVYPMKCLLSIMINFRWKVWEIDTFKICSHTDNYVFWVSLKFPKNGLGLQLIV